MYIKIRNFNVTSDQDHVIDINENTFVSDVQAIIKKKWDIPFDEQKLFYGGKQLESFKKVSDYNVALDDIIQLHIFKRMPHLVREMKYVEKTHFYEIGDQVEVCDVLSDGAWYEAVIKSIRFVNNIQEDGNATYIYYTQMDMESRIKELVPVKFQFIRPRSYQYYKHKDLRVGDVIMVNYNFWGDEMEGYWHDFTISKIIKNKILGSVHILNENGTELVVEGGYSFVMENNNVMRVEVPTPVENKIKRKIPPRAKPVYCRVCNDKPRKKCMICTCMHCKIKKGVRRMVTCGDCFTRVHIECANNTVPINKDWYCRNCENTDVVVIPSKTGESSSSSSDRSDWSKGMARAGRRTQCTIVPMDHFGPVPGIEVGMRWKYRVQVSEAGVHRPIVAGIHGRANKGVFSVVLSGSYEDDVDEGNEFIYTGSGGRNYNDGTRRQAEQTFDQELTSMNKAMTINCNTAFNPEGATTENWKEGKPIRVVRKHKFGKQSKYAPKEGYRYDGIYKVVKYYKEKGKAGMDIWRFVLRRDDPTPAPWEEGGKEFDVIHPEGFLNMDDDTLSNENDSVSNESESISNDSVVEKRGSSEPVNAALKKVKAEPFILSEEVQNAIATDTKNAQLWAECAAILQEGKDAYLKKVEEIYSCSCCKEILCDPVQTQCNHYFCKICLLRFWETGTFTCPNCRASTDTKDAYYENEVLYSILKLLFPNYNIGR